MAGKGSARMFSKSMPLSVSSSTSPMTALGYKDKRKCYDLYYNTQLTLDLKERENIFSSRESYRVFLNLHNTANRLVALVYLEQ